MIIVDISVPVIGKQYNFRLEETAAIREILPEITEVICQKEGYADPGDIRSLELMFLDREVFMDKERSLSSYGVVNGSRLMLV